MSDAWIANLSDGSTHTEQWVIGGISPWQRLMAYCEKNNCYVTNLRLTVGKDTKSCPSNMPGYWQAHGMPSVQGLECDEELHKWRGIGWVEGDTVNIIWMARDPQTHAVGYWMDRRPSKNQAQIIWAKPSMSNINELIDSVDVFRGDADVKNVKEYTDRIIS